MKILKTLAIVVWISFLTVALVSGINWIWSNVATVTITQPITLTLSAPETIEQYHNITLEATLSTALLGKTIEFGTGSETDFSSIGSNMTNSLGKAFFEYNVTENGSVSFIARYQTP